MKPNTKLLTWITLLGLLMFSGACQASPQQEDADPTPTPTPIDPQSLPSELIAIQGTQIRQWAAGAQASSEFSDPEWGAIQALGSPDTQICGDYQTAWATAGSDSIETLVVTYTIPVRVTGVNIVQSFNPNQVVKVELLDPFGRGTEIYNQPPTQIDQPCPYTLPIAVQKTDVRFSRLRITVDQSVLGLGWNQIDAVELVGESE